MANVFFDLPVPADVGVGASVDTSALGGGAPSDVSALSRLKTAILFGSSIGSVVIEHHPTALTTRSYFHSASRRSDRAVPSEIQTQWRRELTGWAERQLIGGDL